VFVLISLTTVFWPHDRAKVSHLRAI